MDDVITAAPLRTTVSRLVDAVLAEYFADRAGRASDLAPRYGRLWHTLAGLNQAGGKRLRPYMVVVAYECFGGQDRESVMPVAAAWEMLHLSMLVHDDIIDKDTVRYGVKNVAGTYTDLYLDTTAEPGRRSHLAMSAALLAGDLALSSAYELVLAAELPDAMKLASQRILADAVFTVAGGELLDTEAAAYPILQADPRLIAAMKTASYSFVGPLVAGAILAGATAVQTEGMRHFGEILGRAFQLADDIISVFGDPTVTGKSNVGDLAEGKPTYMMQAALRGSTAEDQVVLQKLVGKQDVTQTEADLVRAIIVRSGARLQTETEIERLAERAKHIVGGLTIATACQQNLLDLITLATRRNA